MKIAVIGASGLIGTKLVELLTADGHEVVAASRNTGVDVLTGEGLADALAGADALIDVLNSPYFSDGPVMNFFTTSTTNLVAAAKKAGVGHYVALSIVGTRRAAGQRIPAGQGRSGEDHHRIGSAVHARAGHAVRGVHRPDHRVTGRRRRGARSRRVDPADPGLEGGVRRLARGGRRAAQRLREHRWATEDLVRADGPRLAGAPRRRPRPSSSTRRPSTSARRSKSAAW